MTISSMMTDDVRISGVVLTDESQNALEETHENDPSKWRNALETHENDSSAVFELLPLKIATDRVG